MYAKQITIQSRSGLHARPAADFVSQAGKFKSQIGIQRAGEASRADGKFLPLWQAPYNGASDLACVVTIRRGENQIWIINRIFCGKYRKLMSC